MKALYRKYRPSKLSEVVGQEQVTEVLKNSLAVGRVSHAYLFVGPRGTGKTSVARIFAHEVNGFPYTLEDDYVDIVEIDGASNRGIDNIRELREKVLVAPTAGKYKVYIIDEVHMLTKEAFNALLKTLEEPPAHVIFIMATTDAYKVPVTITSRAQTYTFQLARPEVMLAHLKKIAAQEKINITDEALAVIVKRGGGSYRDSLSLLDQISTLSQDEITKDLVIGAMGLPEDEKIEALLEYYAAQDFVKITESLRGLLSSGVKPETIAEELITKIVAAPAAEYLPLLAKLPEIKAPFAEARLLVALLPSAGTVPVATVAVKARMGFTPTVSNLSASKAPVEPAVKPQSVEQPAVPIAESQSTKQPVSVAKSQITQQLAVTPAPVDGDFTWAGFLEKVQALSDAVYSQVSKANYAVDGGTLTIYPDKKIAKTILSRDNNKKVLASVAGGLKIAIGEVGENPNLKKDALLSRISDIMGGEVKNDGGGIPF